MIKPIALANTLTILDLILHPFFHIWAAISPESLTYIMHIFVVGLELNIDPEFDFSLFNLIVGTILEASTIWILGFVGAKLYNSLSTKS